MPKSLGGAMVPGFDYDVSGSWAFARTQTLSGGYVTAVETGSTARPLVNYGVSKITITSSTAGATKAYTLAQPVTGSVKNIVQPTASTGGIATVTAASGSHFNQLGNTIATFPTTGFLNLMATSSSAWAVVGSSTGVTFS